MEGCSFIGTSQQALEWVDVGWKAERRSCDQKTDIELFRKYRRSTLEGKDSDVETETVAINILYLLQRFAFVTPAFLRAHNRGKIE